MFKYKLNILNFIFLQWGSMKGLRTVGVAYLVMCYRKFSQKGKPTNKLLQIIKQKKINILIKKMIEQSNLSRMGLAGAGAKA